MIHSNIEAFAPRFGAAMNDTNSLAGKKLRHREASQGHNHLRVQRLDLAIEEIVTSGNLVGVGVAIFGWAALDHIRDKDIRAFQPDAGQRFFKQASGGSHKWPAL